MEELVNLFVNNGVAVAVIIYFCWRDIRYMNTLQTSLIQLNDTCNLLKDVILKERSED